MKNNNVINSLILAVSISLLTGCGGGGGGSGSSNNGYNEYDNYSTTYYDSSKADVKNLAQPNKVFSAYNGKNNIEIKNIPIDSSKEVLYLF